MFLSDFRTSLSRAADLYSWIASPLLCWMTERLKGAPYQMLACVHDNMRAAIKAVEIVRYRWSTYGYSTEGAGQRPAAGESVHV
jgi:hypothetical protein